MNDFDVVVIGSGLGGLSAAVNLSLNGKKVIVLERHNVPGGYATTFVRGRFEFDASLHELSGLGDAGNPGPVYNLLDEYGVLPRVEFFKIPEFYRILFPGVDVTLPTGRDEFEKILADAFPSEASNIKRFTGLLFDFFSEVTESGLMQKGIGSVDFSKYPLMEKHLLSTLAEVFYPMVKDEKARCVLNQIANYVGQPPSHLSFMTYAMAMASYIMLGPAHIRGFSQALSQAFVDVIEENGGLVRLNNGASEIMTSRGKVVGVVAEDGTMYRTSRVISNANPFETCLNLIDREEMPDWYMKRLSAWTPGLSTFNVWLGLDRPAKDLGFTVHETFVGYDYDLDKLYEEAKTLAPNMNPPGAAVTAYNLAHESFSPPGTTNLVITMAAYGRPWQKLGPKEYLEAKSRQADKAIELAEVLAPDIRKHIEVMETATPVTNLRYTLNPGGSFTGFTENRRPGGAMQIPSRGPLEGLYFACAWVNLGGGYFPSMLNGYIASNELMEDMESGGGDLAAIKQTMTAQTPEGQEIESDRAVSPREAMTGQFSSRMRLEVRQVIEETSSTKTLRLAPATGSIPMFQPGQYVTLFVNINGVATSRAYSISSTPDLPHLDITVRRKPEGFVSHYLLDKVAEGDVLEASGPHGTFFHDPVYDSSDIVLLAGGSGITPMASIIRNAINEGSDLNIHLLYGSRDEQDIVFMNEFETISAAHENIKVDFIISEPAADYTGLCGLLDKEMISRLIGSVEGKTFFLCGPAQMHVLCLDALQSLGVPLRRIKRESYGPPDDVRDFSQWPGIDPEAEFTLVEESSGREIKVRAGEPLLNGLERAGLVVPAVCRSGECTACRTKLSGGSVFTPDSTKKRWIDEKAGFIHPCMSYPISDLRIRL